MPRIMPEARYFSMPSTEVGAEVRRNRVLNCRPWVRSLTHSPDAVIHSPAAIVAAWPTTVTRSRCPRAFVRRTQKPFSTLWKVTRSTRPASTSLGDDSGCGFMRIVASPVSLSRPLITTAYQSRRPRGRSAPLVQPPANRLGLHLDIASRRVLDGGELAAADRPRQDALVVERLDPSPPIGPPRARMLFGMLEPSFELALGRRARPILVAVASRRVDNARDVSRTCKYEFDPTAETARANKDRARRGDMVLPRSNAVDGNLHFRQVDL